MSALRDFHFIYPYWFLAIPAVLLIIWWLSKNASGSQAWQHFIDERLRPFVISGQDQGDGRWLRYGVLFVSLIAIIALAGPSWQKRDLPAFQTQQGLILGLDLSSSMLAADVAPNRLTRARFKLMDLLKLRDEGQTGLVVFAGDAFAVAPLTDDRENIVEQVKNLSPGIMPAQGSLIYRGIDESVELLRQAGYAQGDILIIADGVADLSRTLRSAEAAKAAGYRVSVAAVGTEDAVTIPLSQTDVYRDQQGQPILVKMDKAVLKSIADSGGGLFQSLSLGDDDIERFQQFFQSDNSPLLENNERSVEHWQNEGIWLLWLLLPAALLLFRKGYLFSTVMAFGLGISMVAMPQNSYAFAWDDLWLNSDQQAHEALLKENTEEAKALFKAPEWKAAAAFRNGDFEESAGLFEKQQTAESHYNRGTALAKAGKLEEAIKAYDQTLALQSDHADAKFNRDLLEKMQNEKEKEKQNQDKQDKDKQNKDKNQDQQSQDKKSQDQDQESQKQQSEQEKQAEKAAEEQRKKDAAEREQAEQEAKEKESEEQGDKPEGKAESKKLQSEEEKQQEKETKQWLYQIPDDSSGLWRRKFQYQYRQRQPAPNNGGVQPW